MVHSSSQAQQVSIPASAAEVPGPAVGTAMTKDYVQMVGRIAYLWHGRSQIHSIVVQASRKRPNQDCLAGWCPRPRLAKSRC